VNWRKTKANPAAFAASHPDGGALRLIRATPLFPALCRMAATPYPAWLLNLIYQTLTQHRRPAQAQRRRATVSGSVSVVVPDGGYALSGLPSPQPTSRQQGVPAASPESPNPHNDTFVYCLTTAESLKLKAM
jgi:hypothetical protein